MKFRAVNFPRLTILSSSADHGKSVLNTQLVGRVPQFLQAPALKMQLVSVREAYAVDQKMRVDMPVVRMRRYQNLAFREHLSRVFRRKLVSGLRRNVLIWRKGLDDVIVKLAVGLAEERFCVHHFLECGFRRAVDAGDQSTIIPRCFRFPSAVVRQIFHSRARLPAAPAHVYDLNNRHRFTVSARVLMKHIRSVSRIRSEAPRVLPSGFAPYARAQRADSDYYRLLFVV